MTADEKDNSKNRIIKLLNVDIAWAIDKENIDVIIHYGKIFDEKELDTKAMKAQITRIKEKIVNVLKEEFE